MAKLSKEDVLKLARLSRLRLGDDEVEKMRTELSSILEYVETLDGADTAGLEPTYQVSGLTDVMREDVVKDYGYTAADLLKNVPRTRDGYIEVEKIL